MISNKLYITIILAISFFGLFLTNQNIDMRYNITTTISNGSMECNSQVIKNIESDNINLNMEVELLSSNKDQFYFKDIIHSDSIYLIFIYPKFFCRSCVNEALETLKELIEKMSCIRVIVIISGGSLREMKIKMLPFEDKFPVYLLPDNDIGLPADKTNLPYLIFVDDGKTSKHTLILGDHSAELLRDYIQMLSQKYCK